MVNDAWKFPHLLYALCILSHDVMLGIEPDAVQQPLRVAVESVGCKRPDISQVIERDQRSIQAVPVDQKHRIEEAIPEQNCKPIVLNGF
jgi:hypothetical protein